MTVVVIALVIEIIALIAVCPIKIGLCAHASMERGKIQINVSVFKFNIVRIRVSLYDDDKIKINGKKPKNKQINAIAIAKIAKYAKVERIFRGGKILCCMSSDNAKTTVITTAILALLPYVVGIYGFLSGERMDVDGRLSAKINLLQTAKIAVMAKKRGEYAKVR